MSEDLAMDSVQDLMEDEEEGGHIAKALSDVMDNLDNEEGIKMFTSLNDSEVKILSVLLSLDNDLLDDFGQEFMQLKVSQGRKGRKDVKDVAEAFAGIWGVENQSTTDKIRDTIGL